MSGGVDSAVAAARAVAAGHDVTGVHLALSRNPESYRSGARGCCTIEDSRDAWRAADLLGIPFYVWDMSAEFAADVVDDFLAEYAAGRTPEPVPALQRADQVRRRPGPGPRPRVRRRVHGALRAAGRGAGGPRAAPRGRPRQGPVLRPGRPRRRPAGRLHVPAGRLAEVRGPGRGRRPRPGRRGQARQPRHLLHPERGHRRASCRGASGAAPGEIVDAETGEVVGAHEGAYAFTVGQRRGVGLGTPAPDGARRYVVDVDIAGRRVSVGPAAMLDVDRITAIRPRWCGPALEGSAAPGRAGPGARRGDPRGRDRRRVGIRRRAGQPAAGRGPRPGSGALRRHPGGGLGHDRAGGARERAIRRAVGRPGEPDAEAGGRPGRRGPASPARPASALTRPASTPGRCPSGSPWARTRSASGR